jgi:hypothetical protein
MMIPRTKTATPNRTTIASRRSSENPTNGAKDVRSMHLVAAYKSPPVLMADRWQAKLSRPIVMRDGTKLQTLAEAGDAFCRCRKPRRGLTILCAAAEVSDFDQTPDFHWRRFQSKGTSRKPREHIK